MRMRVGMFPIMVLMFCPTVLSGTVIRVPQDRPTIQSAIQLAEDGDTVLVSPGTYVENIDFLAKDITVASEFIMTGSVECVHQTIIRSDSMQANSVVTIANGQTRRATLCGFTIAGGRGNLLIRERYGGGIFIRRASPSIRNNIITANHLAGNANRGGGIAIIDSANPAITGNTISYNSTIGFPDWINYFGGGIWVDSSSNPVIGGCQADANNIYRNSSDLGWQVYRAGSGTAINAQYNYWGTALPRDTLDLYTFKQFDISHYLQDPVSVRGFESQNVPNGIQLFQNYPNPFNPSTTIKFELPNSSVVRLSVYDLLGREVSVLVNERMNAGVHEVEFDGSNLASGVYFYRLQAGDFVQAKGLVITK